MTPVSLHQRLPLYHVLPRDFGLKPKALASLPATITLGLCTLGISGSKISFVFSPYFFLVLSLVSGEISGFAKILWDSGSVLVPSEMTAIGWPPWPEHGGDTLWERSLGVARAAVQSEDEEWPLKLDTSGRKMCLLRPHCGHIQQLHSSGMKRAKQTVAAKTSSALVWVSISKEQRWDVSLISLCCWIISLLIKLLPASLQREKNCLEIFYLHQTHEITGRLTFHHFPRLFSLSAWGDFGNVCTNITICPRNLFAADYSDSQSVPWTKEKRKLLLIWVNRKKTNKYLPVFPMWF